MERFVTGYILANIPLCMLIISFIFAVYTTYTHHEKVKATFVYDTFLGYILFFVVGLTNLWAVCINLFFTHVASQGSGHWLIGPFQFITMAANLGLGIAVLVALKEHYSFRVATTIMTTCLFWGMAAEEARTSAILHRYDHTSTFYVVLIVPILLIILLFARRSEKKHRLSHELLTELVFFCLS